MENMNGGLSMKRIGLWGISALMVILCASAGCATAADEPLPDEPPKTAIQQQESPAPVRAPEPAPAETEPEPLPMEGRKICIDPGHCVTPDSNKGYREPVSPLSDKTKPRYLSGTAGATMSEEKLNLTVGLKLRDALTELGADVVMTREVSEISLPNTERCRIANESGADVHIHIHADGSENKSVKGVSVLVPGGNLLGTPSIVDESVRLGQLMVDRVAESTGTKNRGIIPRSDLTGLNFSEIPSVFIEMGYMSNPEEDALLCSDAYQDKIVAGMVNSLMDWYGIEKSEGKATPTRLTLEAIRKTIISDVPAEDTRLDCIKYAVYRGYMQTASDNSFSPEAFVTRGELLTALWRVSGEEAPAYDGRFTDVAGSSPLAQPIAWAVKSGIAFGAGNGTFSPQTAVSREQLAVFLYRSVSDRTAETNAIDAYRDAAEISSFARTPLAWALSRGLLDGMVSDTIHPALPVSRGQLAQILTAYAACMEKEPLAQTLACQLKVEQRESASRAHHDEIQDQINVIAAKYGAMGLQAAVVEDGEVTDTFSYGWAVRDSVPMTSEL